ncbi:MAG TPA: amidoligase family protein [Saprospiraceae bacterium]|nr:amidoligase family protein [Saprospiraceae bacterium]
MVSEIRMQEVMAPYENVLNEMNSVREFVRQKHPRLPFGFLRRTYTCPICGLVYEISKLHIAHVEGQNIFMCEECADEKIVLCSLCHHPTRKNIAFYSVPDERYICQHCWYNGNMASCPTCRRIVPSTELIHGDMDVCCVHCVDTTKYHQCTICGNTYHVELPDDHMMCPICAREYAPFTEIENHKPDKAVINSYYYKPTPHFLRESCEPLYGNLYIGVELEMDSISHNTMIPATVAHDILVEVPEVYCKRDGSLHNGVEVVSHPATLGYHLHKLNWVRICELAQAGGMASHDLPNCGLHCHVNRTFFGKTPDEQDLNISKVILLIHRFWKTNVITFSRRDIEAIEHYAKNNIKSTTVLYKDQKQKEIEDTIKGSYKGDRNVAINLCNKRTIELRIFRGTLNYETLCATLEFVDTICRFAKRISLSDIDAVAWEDIFVGTNYPELNAYMKRIFHEHTKVLAPPIFAEPQGAFRVGDCVELFPLYVMLKQYQHHTIIGKFFVSFDFGIYSMSDLKTYCGTKMKVVAVNENDYLTVALLDGNSKPFEIHKNFIKCTLNFGKGVI